jgi:glycosyltransferase involved in cell wall biosynthesis
MSGGGGASRARVAYVSAGAQTLRQFRLPLLERQARRFERLVLYLPEDPPHTDLLRERGLEVAIGPVGSRPSPRTPFEIARLARFLARERIDVVIGHQPMGSLVGLTAAWLAGVAVRIYSTGGLKYVPGRRGPWNWLMRAGEARLIAAASAVLLVNREDEALLGADPRTRDKAIYVGPRGGCGVDTDRFSPAARLRLRPRARAEIGAAEGEFLVGTSGRLVWEKGYRELIQAAERLGRRPGLPRLRFVVLGSGRDVGGIRARVDRAGLADRFVFLGYRLDPEIWLSALDLFVLASRREGLPMALLEALALGLPAVATDVRGSRELIPSGDTGRLVPLDQPEALADAIEEVARMPDRGEAIGLAAARHVGRHYRQEALLERTLGLIEAVIAGGPDLTGKAREG